jgi:hypothetical protein
VRISKGDPQILSMTGQPSNTLLRPKKSVHKTKEKILVRKTKIREVIIIALLYLHSNQVGLNGLGCFKVS